MRDYVDARINEVNANIESSQTKIDADLQGVTAELKRLPGTWTLISVAGTAVGLLLAILAVMGDRFDAGMAANSTSTQQVQEVTKTSQEAQQAAEKVAQDMAVFNKKWDARGEKLDQLLPKLEQLLQQANDTPQKGQGDILKQE